jgi:glutathionyl-hydroquinone reductase
VVDGIVSLELIKQIHETDSQLNINNWLIRNGFAQEAEESYLSRVSALWSNVNALNWLMMTV